MIELHDLSKENLMDQNFQQDKIKSKKINIEKYEKILSEVTFIILKIKDRKLNLTAVKNKTESPINYFDFVEEICFYLNQKDNTKTIDKLNMDLDVSIFKIKLGERFVTAFESEGVIKNI